MSNNSNKTIILIIRIFLILSIFMISVMGFIVFNSLADTQVLYYKCINDVNITYDYSGYNNHGTNYNITSVTGIFNSAAVFNGYSSFIETENPSNLSFTDNTNDKPFSVSYWVNHCQGLGQPILEKGSYLDGNAEYTIGIPIDTMKNTFYINDATGGYLECQTNEIITAYDHYNGWIHFFHTYDGINDQNGMKTYINGVLVNTSNVKIGAAYVCMKEEDTSLFVGRQEYITLEYLNAYLDELIIYDYEVDLSEVKCIFDQYKITGYSIIFLNEHGIINKNISVYKNKEFIKEIQYGDTLDIENTYTYTFVIETDLTDKFNSIDNINDVSRTSVTPTVYIIIIGLIIGLIIYLIKK